MSRLGEYLRSKKDDVRAEAAVRKAKLEGWERATAALMDQLGAWLREADTENVLTYNPTDHVLEGYDQSRHVVRGMQIKLGDATFRIVPDDLRELGVLRIPTEIKPQRITGRVNLENGTDRRTLYRVQVGHEDRWYWWSQDGFGRPLDRDSFEAAVVDLLK